ncbi:MAG: cell wall synthase accessory phosphoprotein MacP, partial [Enterococcus aquimarinus]
MAKGPLVTRSELRKRKIESPSEQTKEQKQAQRDYQQEEKKINNYYRKQAKQQSTIQKTRTGEKEKSRRMNHFLMKWILIVTVLLIL